MTKRRGSAMSRKKIDRRAGGCPESWNCVDCGFNTGPEMLNARQMDQMLSLTGGASQRITSQTEMYIVHPRVWKAAGMKPWGGCLCIGCLEKRLERTLTWKDFPQDHPFMRVPGTARLLSRRTKPAGYTTRQIRQMAEDNGQTVDAFMEAMGLIEEEAAAA